MSAYHQLLACPLVLQIDYVSPEPKTIIFRIQFISTRVIRICVTKGVQLSLVRPTKACFGWIPSNRWIFHHSSSFLMTLGPSSSAFVSFLSYRWLFNVATSFVNGPLLGLLWLCRELQKRSWALLWYVRWTILVDADECWKTISLKKSCAQGQTC